MKITLFRDLPTEHWRSMERYADELAHGLRDLGRNVESYVLPRPFSQLRGATNALANQAWRSIVYPLAARSHQGDVNHIVDHSYAHLVNALDPRRTVVTCHDIAPLALNEGRGISRYLWNQSFRAMLRAAHIIADSDFTRSEILRHANYPANQITVVPLGVDQVFFEPPLDSDIERLRVEHHLTGKQIVLHVGSCAPRKNVETILRAMTSLRDCVFVQVGGQFNATQNRLIDELGLRERVIQISSATETELRLWYNVANVFVMPSTYEGFGLPVLEAMASGTPVIASHCAALVQVAGDAALLTDPRDSIKLAEQIQLLLSDATRADEMRARGIARAKQFTWERTARETLAVYRQIVMQ